MKTPRLCFGDAWVCVAFALLAPAAARLNVDEMQAMQTTSNEVKVSEQPLTSTKKPELAHNSTHLKLGKCFHMPRSACPERGQDCRVIDGVSVFCCDVGNTWLREGLHTYLTQTTVHLHVSNAHIAELNVSAAVFRRLTSMAFTDGSIGKIVGQFLKHSSIACLNISNNNLTTAKLEPASQRPFAYLFNLTVLDASANNLTEFPLSLVQSNRKISVDFSGNNYLPCKHFQKAMEAAGNSSSTLVTFINYENTKCALGVQYDWFKDVQFVNIDHLKEQKALNDSCRKIRPPDINCTCATRRLEIFGNEVTNLVAVDCSQRRLKEMPTNLPANTVELNVSYNNITSLTAVGDDPTYESLRQLIVHHNDIDKIIPLEGTKFIDNFMLFSISHNKLRTIPTYLLSNKFDANGNYITLFVGGNDIVCDCNQVKIIKEWLLEHLRNIPDYKELMCQDGLGSVADLDETVVCHTARDWTDYIYYIIALEVLILVLLITKVSYDYWVFKTAGYLPWPANKMPRLPCDWLCE